MLYAILCYDSEETYATWTKDQEDAVLAQLAAIQANLAAQGKLGPVARLMPTTTATTVRKGREAIVLDGPFAETKEQLLGFYVVACGSLDEALAIARDLGRSMPATGTFEVRPILQFEAGGPVS